MKSGFSVLLLIAFLFAGIGIMALSAKAEDAKSLSPEKKVVRTVTISELGNVAAVQLLNADLRPSERVSAR